MSAAQTYQLAVQRHLAGDLAAAESLCRQVLQLQPDHPDALHRLGLLAHSTGRLEEAADLISRAISRRPAAAYYLNRGAVLLRLGRLPEAASDFRAAIALQKDYLSAMLNLSALLRHMGEPDEAISACRDALALRPDLGEIHDHLGLALLDKGHPDQAAAAHRRAAELSPRWPLAWIHLGDACTRLQQFDQAAAAYAAALALQPDHFGVRLRRGDALFLHGRFQEALVEYDRALAAQPDSAEAHCNRGNALCGLQRYDDAIPAYERAIALRPNFANCCNSLANALMFVGQIDRAIEYYHRAVEIDPSDISADSNRVYMLYFHPAWDSAAILREHRVWEARHAQPLRHLIRPHDNDRSPDRPLRVGYLSPDFRRHVQALFTAPLFSSHNREQFQIYCYSAVSNADSVTRRLQGFASAWRPIAGQSDDAVAQQIRADRIDILVDLSMHMAHGRPRVMARKPAPVQVAYLAYPGTTGMTAIDYRLTDPYLDPPGRHDDWYVERSIRLPHTFWCYDPYGMELGNHLLPDPGPPPAHRNGTITFGCLNSIWKFNSGVLELWSRLLRRVAGSRLRLMAPHGQARRWVLEELARHRIEPAMVDFVCYQPRQDYLAEYQRIDIALDTLPYNGHTTSLDAFWMGVPVISRLGSTVMGRAGFSQLSNLGLTELLADDDERFVAIAAELAADSTRLTDLRRTLRARLSASALMDAPRFARDVEAAYRSMWRAWSQSQ
jgi:predicted O-linked N-acetylglucosamine transferase (SPINDLY family)